MKNKMSLDMNKDEVTINEVNENNDNEKKTIDFFLPNNERMFLENIL